MPLARTYSIALVGVEGHTVEVEADIANGLVGLLLVGLPDTALREARDRIRSAIVNSGLEWPQRKITVGLSPASLPKRGSAFDLAIAVAILARRWCGARRGACRARASWRARAGRTPAAGARHPASHRERLGSWFRHHGGATRERVRSRAHARRSGACGTHTRGPAHVPAGGPVLSGQRAGRGHRGREVSASADGPARRR